MKAKEIRKKFNDYFCSNDHVKKASSSIIPQNDPTLLFANAGMNQFKDFFTGQARPDHKQVITIQKCVRAGGKHNDLENVGFTARHHTFFEMYGNFSFNGYFKDGAIELAWNFLTKELKVPKEKLLVTVHHSDDEAYDIWTKKIGIPEDKIFRLGDKDNFWEMGEYGPCGPCSEIFYDHGPERSDPNFKLEGDLQAIEDEGRYVEIWNLVFMQFEKTPEGKFPLPNPCIDTGGGLERIAAALQGVYWNYDTDLFMPLINQIEKLTGKKYSDEEFTSSIRIAAEHMRSTTMLITDGVLPANDGRGYVLRRIIRRMVRHFRKMGAPEGICAKLVSVVFDILGDEYPENKANQSLAEKILDLEEKRFLETIDVGLNFLDDSIKNDLKGDTLPGESVFKLYDTYGFPVDLTETILLEKNLKADIPAFEKLMEKRKEESKKTWKGGQMADNKKFFEIRERHGETKFEGYKTTETKAKLLEKIELGDHHALVFDKTPFYGESGGQAGDKGNIFEGDQVLAVVFDCQKPVENLYVHFTENADLLEVGKTYSVKVDQDKRDKTAKNHTATHLLQAALINVLGDHVKQAGSFVNHEKLRFDFTHYNALTKDELKSVEQLVNQQIRKATDVEANIMTKDQALEKGAMALFGEKYGDDVRVLEIGEFSIELCGGTHVNNTGDISSFTITTDSSIAAGVRRIEAITSDASIERMVKRSELIDQMEGLLKVKESAVVERVEALLSELKSKSKEISELRDKLQAADSKSLFDSPEKVKGQDYFERDVPEGSDLRKISDLFSDKFKEGFLLLVGKKGDKAAVLLKSANKKSSVNCGKILKDALQVGNGRGGGKPDMAQGSCDFSAISEVKKKIKTDLEASL